MCLQERNALCIYVGSSLGNTILFNRNRNSYFIHCLVYLWIHAYKHTWACSRSKKIWERYECMWTSKYIQLKPTAIFICKYPYEFIRTWRWIFFFSASFLLITFIEKKKLSAMLFFCSSESLPFPSSSIDSLAFAYVFNKWKSGKWYASSIKIFFIYFLLMKTCHSNRWFIVALKKFSSSFWNRKKKFFLLWKKERRFFCLFLFQKY